MQKGDVLENLVIETMAAEGKCLAKVDGKVIFLKGGAPGDVVDVAVSRIKSNYLEGNVVTVKEPSSKRTDPFCSHFGMCGGCSWQHINYETQLYYKRQQVVDNLEHIGGLTLPDVQPILPSQRTRYYRNRLDFTFSSMRWLMREEMNTELSDHDRAALGFHMPKMFDKVFDVAACHLQPDPSNGIRLAVKDEALKNKIPFFDLRQQVGFLRTLTIRTANTGDTMVILQVSQNKMEWIEKILSRIAAEFPQVTSLNYVVNGKRNDTFNDLNVVCWKGDPYITETMPRPGNDGATLQFRVGPKSFYQTNSDQAHALYYEAWKMAELTGNELVYDLYTGTGTIANFVADHARQVIGLEYVPEAINDARVNSELNGITNTLFFAGDIKDLLGHEFLKTHGRPDVVITDPPRAGMHEDVCKMLLQAAPQRIVYVSCNPATQARDLKLLAEKYSIHSIQPVDMFPHTMHVENIVRLERLPEL